MSPTKEVAISFESFAVTNINYSVAQNANASDNNLEISIINKSRNFEENHFDVIIELVIKNADESLLLNLTTRSRFKTKDAITEDFKTSKFMDVNVPAIVFPYIRAFVTTLTSNSDISAIILPTFNFTSLRQDN